MLASTDWAGLAAVISAVFAGVAACIAAYFGAHNAGKLSTPSGAPNIGQAVANVAAAVSTPPGKDTLGAIVSDAADAVAEVKQAVNGGPGHPPVTGVTGY